MPLNVGLALALSLATPASTSAAAPAISRGEEIVVEARRSGIPVWSVTRGGATLLLVGTIADPLPGTNWNPDRLKAALLQSDQVMFPQGTQFRGGMLAAMGASGKARRLEWLPKPRTLADYLTAAQLARLAALRDRGLVKAGFERKSPLALAGDLTRAAATGDARSSGGLSISKIDWKADPQGFVRYLAKHHRVPTLPMREDRIGAVLDRVAAASPAEHVPCLMQAVSVAEGGRSPLVARSQAWVLGRIAEVMRSPMQAASSTCADALGTRAPIDSVDSSVMSALGRPMVTMAVLDLSTLAQSGGILDRLAGRGYAVAGPKWK